MSDYFKCAECGRSFEKSGTSKFLSGATMGISNLGKKYCSKACERNAEAAKNGTNSAKNVTSTNDYPSASSANSGGTTVVNKGPGFGAFMGKALGDTLTSSMDHMKESAQESRNEERELKNKIEDLASMKMAGEKEELMEQLNYLSSLASAKPDKKLKQIIIEKMDFGILKLNGMNAQAEALYFEKKLEPLKKKSWF